MTMTFREAVDIRIAQLQGRPVDKDQLREAMRVIHDEHATPKAGEPVHAAAAVRCGNFVTLAPILVVDFYRGAA